MNRDTTTLLLPLQRLFLVIPLRTVFQDHHHLPSLSRLSLIILGDFFTHISCTATSSSGHGLKAGNDQWSAVLRADVSIVDFVFCWVH